MFTNASHLLRRNPLRYHYGIAVTDLDGDGAFEVVVAGFGSANQVLKWNGREFVDIADAVVADANRQTIGSIAADIDGDGREELYLLNTDAEADRLLCRRDNGWVDLLALPDTRAQGDRTAGRSAVCVDRGGNGRYGIFVTDYGGSMRLYELHGDRLRDVAAEVGLNRVAGVRGVVALPLVSDRMDIFATNENGGNFLFRDRGDGTYEEMARAAGLSDAQQTGRCVAVLDADGDGKFDLVYGNTEGSHCLFLQGATGHFRNVAPQEMARPSQVRTVIAADFDNDGIEEILFNNLSEPNRLFGLRDGAWRQLDIGDAWEPDDGGTGATVGDFDGDGRLELLVAHGHDKAQPLSLYRPRPTENGWLRVLPLTRYGAPARGAVCRLIVGGEQRVRAIDAGSGYLCQMEPVAHFGLGLHRRIDRLDVFWPDGTKVSLDSPMANQLVRVPYPGSDKPPGDRRQT